MIGVYAFIENGRGTGKSIAERIDYIGSSINVEKRLDTHFSSNREFALPSSHILVQEFETEAEARLWEARLIDMYRPRYNRTYGKKKKKRRFLLHEVKNLADIFDERITSPWSKTNKIDSILEGVGQ